VKYQDASATYQSLFEKISKVSFWLFFLLSSLFIAHLAIAKIALHALIIEKIPQK